MFVKILKKIKPQSWNHLRLILFFAFKSHPMPGKELLFKFPQAKKKKKKKEEKETINFQKCNHRLI